MKDYIDVLIDDLETRIFQLTPEYSRQVEREAEAEKALMASLDDAQRDLYMTCEEARNKANDLYETGMFRQIFLLAREVYR